MRTIQLKTLLNEEAPIKNFKGSSFRPAIQKEIMNMLNGLKKDYKEFNPNKVTFNADADRREEVVTIIYKGIRIIKRIKFSEYVDKFVSEAKLVYGYVKEALDKINRITS